MDWHRAGGSSWSAPSPSDGPEAEGGLLAPRVWWAGCAPGTSPPLWCNQAGGPAGTRCHSQDVVQGVSKQSAHTEARCNRNSCSSDTDGLDNTDPVPACLLAVLLFSPCCTGTPEHCPQVEGTGINPSKSMENCWIPPVGKRVFCISWPQSFFPQLKHTSLPSCGAHI